MYSFLDNINYPADLRKLKKKGFAKAFRRTKTRTNRCSF